MEAFGHVLFLQSASILTSEKRKLEMVKRYTKPILPATLPCVNRLVASPAVPNLERRPVATRFRSIEDGSNYERMLVLTLVRCTFCGSLIHSQIVIDMDGGVW